ncbi:uncharacterized protein [Spinacia oleracea]|uniref:RIN4 pathogenic type III effector avirulence factor Avr cleavage site domain-containing protein n=1 Tax=Spinacia oleracea TaxID=3562 RepID=A0ABM3RT82_SPIOL|nr:uncharacterized protein LOC130472283 [Spinacia oleracea]
MEGRGKDKKWKSVPQFGGWDQKGAASPNYSMVFGQARAHRKQAKTGVRHMALRNEPVFTAPPNLHVHRHHHDHHHDHRPDRQEDHEDDSTVMKKNKFMAYCCIMPY